MKYEFILFSLILGSLPGQARAQGAELTWFGHAAFQIKTTSGKIILVDPWITNPSNPQGKDQLAKLDKADLILVSHGHFDHVGDAVAIAKKTGARLVTTFDLANVLSTYGGYPAKQMGFDSLGNFGGSLSLLDGEVIIRLVPAVHGSTYSSQVTGNNNIYTTGASGGFVIQVKGGPAIYHTGDTDVFSDMELIGKAVKIDYMLACIGGHFTMDAQAAAQAIKFVNPANVVPMHFGTFPVLTGTPDELGKALKKAGSKAKVRTMKIGETMKL